MSQWLTSSISVNFSFTTNVSVSNQTTSINQTYNATIPETPGRQYENTSIPPWEFNSTCKWNTAVYVDLAFAGMGVLYNAMIFLFPFLFSRMKNTHGGFMGSYAAGSLLCCIYYVYFDVRLLVSDDATLGEKSVVYAIIIFLAYHLVIHSYLLTWDQYRSVFRCNSHLGYASRDRLTKIVFIAWLGSVMLPVVEACFMNNISNFPHSPEISQFRLVCLIIVMLFFWFIPLFITISWNADLFCWFVRAIQNGHVVIATPLAEQIKQELDGTGVKDEEEFEVEEFPTLPDDLRFEFARTTAHLATTTIYCALILVWVSYHVLAILRTAKIIESNNADSFSMYDTIFNCYLYICLYCFVKISLMFNPLGYFYFREEFRKVFRRLIRKGNDLEILVEEPE